MSTPVTKSLESGYGLSESRKASIRQSYNQNLEEAISRYAGFGDHVFNSALRFSREPFIDILDACGGRHGSSGSYLFDGKEYTYCGKMYQKQRLLFRQASHDKTNSLLEIGVYMGHSLLLALCANPALRITCIDLSSEYSLPAIEVLKHYFPMSAIDFIHADSLTALHSMEDFKYDLIHIDGCHDQAIIRKEADLLSKRFSASYSKRFIFDDQQCCRDVIMDILATDKVLEYERPLATWPNCYLRFTI